MFDWRKATNEDALRAWDAGESVWSCELGGLGPGYEQCIQIMGFEMLRAILANPPPIAWDAFDSDPKAARAWWDRIEALAEVRAIIGKLQPSGAQVGAARNIAGIFARRGYSQGMEMVPADRRIQVRKHFPSLDEMPTAEPLIAKADPANIESPT